MLTSISCFNVKTSQHGSYRIDSTVLGIQKTNFDTRTCLLKVKYYVKVPPPLLAKTTVNTILSILSAFCAGKTN